MALAAAVSWPGVQDARAGDAAVDAAAIYQRRCSVCHGEQGNGQSLASRSLAVAPRDFTSDESGLRLTREYMIAVLRDGRSATPMVGRASQLSRDEMEAVVDFIRAAFMVPEPGSDRAQGHAIYRQQCAACHGPRGRGVEATSPGALASTPLRRGAPPARDRVLAAVLGGGHGSGAAAFRLSAPEAQAVAEYVSTAFIEATGRK